MSYSDLVIAEADVEVGGERCEELEREVEVLLADAHRRVEDDGEVERGLTFCKRNHACSRVHHMTQSNENGRYKCCHTLSRDAVLNCAY